MCFIKAAQNRMIDKRVNLTIITSIELVIEYKDRHSTEIKQYKTLCFHDSLYLFKNLSFFLSFLCVGNQSSLFPFAGI